MKLYVAGLAAACGLLWGAEAPRMAEAGAPWKTAVAPAGEPGERLTVSGVVLGSNGKPVANASVYVYQTDAKGLYSPGVNDNRNPRLRGYMRTDAQGRYEYSTIKPAPYPGDGPPAHIHYHVNAPGYEERVFEIVFEGDPKVTEDIRRRAGDPWSGFSLRPLEREGGGLRCRQDVTLRRQ